MTILVLHGGAGGDGPWGGLSDLDPKRIACLEAILSDVGKRLESGELDALEAVTLAVEAMEDEPLYNAGKGSVISANSLVTMDASIMRGHDKAVGSMVNLTGTRHPIRAANIILKKGWPIMLLGEAGDRFAHENGVEKVSQDWLQTDLRKAQWNKWKTLKTRPGATDEDDEAMLDHDLEEEDKGMGTVGAVALDSEGRLAAATSTGGMTGKPDGRVGDTPIIGAGTWADDDVAVSCTGIGESFIRVCAAHELSHQFRASGDLQLATKSVLEMVAQKDGRGGIIAVSKDGQFTLPFDTQLMYRGAYINGEIFTGIGPETYVMK